MKKLMAIIVVTCLMTVPASAALVNYTVGGWAALPPTFAGDSWSGDTLEYLTYTGSLDLTPGTYDQKINTFDWIIDATSYTNSYDFNVIADRSIAFDGGPSGSLSQSGTLMVRTDNDSVSFNNGSTVTFNVQGYTVEVTPLGFSRAGGDHGEPFTGLPWYQDSSDVMARFVVIPEPGTWMLLVLSAMGLLIYSRRGR